MTSREREWEWRYELLPTAEQPEFDQMEVGLNNAWRQLVLIHSSFSATDQKEYRALGMSLREIEGLFYNHPELSSYYDEWSTATPATPNPPPAPPSPGVRHVVAIQAQLMEDVYFVLKLSRFPNALDNRGWMNLFRAWGRSKTFNAFFDQLRLTFSQEFEEFYDLYIRAYPGSIEEFPVPHPWDSKDSRQDPRPAARAAARAGDRRTLLPGIFLDSGVHEAGRHPERRHSRGPSPGTGSRGVKDDSGKVGNPTDQQQSGGGGNDPSKKVPPNA